jgi:putative oxidoreductase
LDCCCSGALAYGTYVAEVVAPLLLIAGAWTRIAALVIAFDMGMAVTLVLQGRVFSVNAQGGGWGIELEALIFFVAMGLGVMGGGRWAVVPD